jgi:hypothetical protein
MPKKGSKYIFCTKCAQKRYCTITVPKSFWRKARCSKGHEWNYEVPNVIKVMELQIETLIPRIREMFEREDFLFAKFSKLKR